MGGVFFGRGQEAISAGSAVLAQPENVVCPSHRDLVAFLIRGMELNQFQRLRIVYIHERSRRRQVEFSPIAADIGHVGRALEPRPDASYGFGAALALVAQSCRKSRRRLCRYAASHGTS